MLKLIIEEKDQKVQSATVPLRWCVDKRDLEALKREKVVNPHVLIVTVANSQEMTRQLAPLDQMMAYVQFRKPGKNTIFAAVITNYRDDNYNDLWKKYLRKKDGHYRTDVIDSEGQFLGQGGTVDIEYAEIDITVPDDLFAPEPPAWEKKWVNLFFGSSPRDQCEYRKRRIIAYTLQPVLVAIWLILKIFIGLAMVILLVLLCGMRGIRFKPLFHPFGDNLTSIWWHRERTVFKPEVGTDYRTLKFLLPLAPVYWLSVYAVVSLISFALPGKGYGYGYLSEAIYPTILIVGGSMAFLSLFDIIDFLLRIYNAKQKKSKAEKREYEIEQKYEFDLQALACNHADLKPRLDALPKSRRTIYLRFWDLKAKVCRPFAE